MVAHSFISNIKQGRLQTFINHFLYSLNNLYNMKFLQRLFFITTTLLFFIGCKKEYSVEQAINNISEAQWQFKQGATTFKGPMDTAYINDLNGIKQLSIEGTADNGKDKIQLDVFSPEIKKGTYKSPVAFFSYLKNGASSIYENDLADVNGFTIIIDKIDTVNVSGTFSGRVKDSAGTVKTITDGKFKASFKGRNAVVTPPRTGNGQLTFWASQGCNGNGPITIKVNGQSGTISTFSTTAPAACGGSGLATFTLLNGNYVWSAFCGTDSLTGGTVAVAVNSCVKQEVSLIPVCKIEKWYEVNSNNNNTEFTYTNFFNGNNINRFTFYDSLNAQLYGNFNISASAIRVQVDKKQYFVINNNKQVTEFHGYADPIDTSSGEFIMRYVYNNGNITGKNIESLKFPAVDLYKIQYTYNANNLVKIESKIYNGTTYIKDYSITYEYDLAVPVKGFLNLAGGYEMVYFQTAVNFPATSTHKLTKATAVTYNTDGSINSTDVTLFNNYVFNAAKPGYVESFKVSNNDFAWLNLYQDYKYLLQYKCF
jgi:hypothetical protein